MPDPIVILIGLGVGLSGVAVAVRKTLRRRRVDNLLDDGRAHFVDGEPTTVVGTVRSAGRTLAAPFSGHACVAYRARAAFTTARRDGMYEDPPPNIEHVEVIPFELETARGLILVDAPEVVLHLDARPVIPRDVERESAFMRKLGIATAMRDVSCEEVYVRVGQRVAAHGVLWLEAMPTDSYRETAIRARLRPGPAHAITIGES